MISLKTNTHLRRQRMAFHDESMMRTGRHGSDLDLRQQHALRRRVPQTALA
jgi:hypothetical protein